MADVVREIERKYEATDRTRLPDLDVRGVRSVVAPGAVALDATYYDTSDHRLAADGVTLRRRTGGSDSGWHLKLPVEPGVREEIRAPLTDGPDLPVELTSLIRSRVRGEPLVPVVRLRQEREPLHLLGADGELLAEVSVDHVAAERFGPGGGTAAWTEVEAELGEGQDPALLDRIEKRLRGAGLRRASAVSKLERALTETEPSRLAKEVVAARDGKGRDAAPGKAGKGGKPATAGDAVLRYVTEQIRTLVALDPAVRRDLPDSVHRMRVATRRLRSCFRSYGKVLDRDVTRPVGEELKWLAAELGVDRDREVLYGRLAERAAELPEDLRVGPVEARLATSSHISRDGSRQRLLAVLDGPRYLALLEALAAVRTHPPLLPGAGKKPRAVLRKAVHRDFERLATYVGEALAAPSGDVRDVAAHEARKAAKRTRYAAEVARPVFGERAKRYAKRMTELQELLGEHQDSVVARAALRDLALQAHAAGEPSFSYGVMHAHETARATACEHGLPALWRSITSKDEGHL
ncbi:CYTH and CHAD domain-containing protein [Streptomyces daliensis]|uniref:CYTH and CHAD domain-containing protein n=1 Tax=Streptomyces daliensis TaxID=299421 RepID=A0A8T4INU6_9ACTN|nr:CYTH and CHAD domain-containing protein [Streptomyces daliensis]